MVSVPPAGRAPATPVQTALTRCRGGLLGVAVFSAAANVLLLVAPVYMLQIYDRVLPSASHATLIALTGVAVFLLSCFGLLDWMARLSQAQYTLDFSCAVWEEAAFQGSVREVSRNRT